MSTTLQRGGKVYVAAFGHSPLAHHGGQLAADPRIFTRLNNAYEYLARPGEKDFVLAITSDWEPASERWRDPELIRRAGRGVAYVISGFRVEPQELRPKERIIDQHWPPGDAIVPVEGYDVRICPSSSIVGESIMWALAMQVSANLHNEGRE